jgi:SAM-dependent methyltransferase
MDGIYNAFFFDRFYEVESGQTYRDWMPQFERIADRIALDFAPRTVLDAGCAYGFLVDALRRRGIEAYGFDLSEHAISQVPEDVKPFCFVHSIAEPLPSGIPQRYDLVVTVEVLEHVAPELMATALANLCRCSDTVLFTSTPGDRDNMTHLNVQLPEYWARAFAAIGFQRDLIQDVDYVCSWAQLFRKGPLTLDSVQAYEKRLRLLGEEKSKAESAASVAESATSSCKGELERISEERETLAESIGILESTLSRNQAEHAQREEEFQKLLSDHLATIRSSSWRATAPLRAVLNLLRGRRTPRFVKPPKGLAARVGPFRRLSRALRRYGLRGTLRKVLRRLQGRPEVVVAGAGTTSSSGSSPRDAASVELRLAQRFRIAQPIPSVFVENERSRLTLVTDSLGTNSLFGGVATALILATRFAVKTGSVLRIVTRTAPVHPDEYYACMKIHGITPAPEVVFYSDYDRDEAGGKRFKLDVSERDVFFATSWWSAAAIRGTTLRRRFFYVLQEVETYFYPHGDDHLRCAQTMKDPDMDFLVNSHYLYDHLKTTSTDVAHRGFCFEPAFPEALYRPKNFGKKARYRLFFYARPENPRNLFHFGLEVLDRCISTGVLDTEEWEICFAGQNVPDIRFSNGARGVPLGQLGWDAYAGFLGGVDLALSLMYTPHPSYPPFDVASSGGVVVTNRYLGKTEIVESDNILAADLDLDSFALAMKAGISLAKDAERRERNFRTQRIARSWEDNLAESVDWMEERLRDA